MMRAFPERSHPGGTARCSILCDPRGGLAHPGWTAGLLIFCLGIASPAHALDPHRLITQYVLDTWYAKDGLPQNSVHSIVQTRDGYLWLGTEECQAPFEGVTFVVFDRANTPAIRSNYIPCMSRPDERSR